MKKTDIAYMAGIFDGEGSITIAKRPATPKWNPCYYLKVNIGMANEYIPKLFQFYFGGSIYRYEPRGLSKLPLWNLKLTTRQATELLSVLLPYLKLKRNEAELAIAFQAKKQHGGMWGESGYKSDEQLAVEEAQYILMKDFKNKSEVVK